MEYPEHKEIFIILEFELMSENVCLIGRAMRDLAEPYRTALERLISTPYARGGESDAEVAKIMIEAGIRSSETSVGRHRRGVCACIRDETSWKNQNLIAFSKLALTVTP